MPPATPPSDPGAVQASAARRLLEQGRLAEAATLLAEVRRSGLSSAALLHAEGALALAHGEFALAEERLRASLDRDDTNAEAHYQLGRLLKEGGQLRAAIAAYDRAIALDPAYWQAHSSRGIAARAAGLIQQAIQSQEQVLALRPGEASAHLNLANALLAANEAQRAAAAYAEVLKRRPDDPAATRGQLFANAMRLLFDGQWQDALTAYRDALVLEPGSVSLQIGHGVALLRCGASIEAQARLAEARALPVNDIVQCWMLGRVLLHLGRQCREALLWFERARSLCPGPTPLPLLRDQALALIYLGNFVAAESVIAEVLAADPQDARARFFQGLLELWRDDYREGFRHYEERFLAVNASAELPTGRPRNSGLPWTGEPLAGRRLFLWAEQGAGDALQFVRFLPVLLAREPAMQLDFVLHDELKDLLAASFPTLSVHGVSDPMPSAPADFEAPLMSLPQLLDMPENTQPVPTPYLHAADDRIAAWQARLGPRGRLRVGLAWAGNPDHFRDPFRSLPLALLAPLNDSRIEFHALQKGPAAAEMDALPDFPIKRTSAAFRDFHDTAAAITQLDLVISVDTSIVHLAGGLGVPVWVMLSKLGEWRWGLERETCRWYPTARLFRQQVDGDWTPVIASLRAALQGWIDAQARR